MRQSDQQMNLKNIFFLLKYLAKNERILGFFEHLLRTTADARYSRTGHTKTGVNIPTISPLP